MWFSAIYAHVPYGKSEHHSLSSALPNTHTHTLIPVLLSFFILFIPFGDIEICKLWFSFSRAKLFGGKRVLYFRNLDLKYQEKKSEGDSHDP